MNDRNTEGHVFAAPPATKDDAPTFPMLGRTYMACGGKQCPYCGHPSEPHIGRRRCDSCRKQWLDLYAKHKGESQLIGYDPYPPKRHEVTEEIGSA